MRERRTSLYPIALSPAKLADCLGVLPRVVADAIKLGDLPCYKHGTKRRVLVQDAVQYIKQHWRRV